MGKAQIRNNPGQSSYFQNRFKGYGRYQWNIKFYGFQSESEQESALSWAFGDHVKVGVRAINGNVTRGFDGISELLGRPIESSTAGRSGGWLVIDTELTDAELALVDSHVEACLKNVAEFLKDEREFHASETESEESRRAADLERLKNDTDVRAALECLDRTGLDFELTVDGIKLV